MEILSSFDWQTVGFVPLVTFGAVAAVNFKWKLNSEQNFLLSIGFALLASFVPADLGSEIANRLKDAIAVAIALNGAYQGLSKIALKLSGKK